MDKTATTFDLRLSNTRYPNVPLRDKNLLSSTKELNAARTHRFQQVVGLLVYISTSTCPDVARAHLVLARALQNLGQKAYICCPSRLEMHNWPKEPSHIYISKYTAWDNKHFETKAFYAQVSVL